MTAVGNKMVLSVCSCLLLDSLIVVAVWCLHVLLKTNTKKEFPVEKYLIDVSPVSDEIANLLLPSLLTIHCCFAKRRQAFSPPGMHGRVMWSRK